MEFDDTFNCNGKVNSNDWQLSRTSFVRRGELENIFYPSKEYRFSETNICLFDHVLPASVAALNLSHFAKCMEMQLKILNRHESYDRIGFTSKTEDQDFYEIRKSVCDFVSYIRAYLHSMEQQCYEAKKSFFEMETELDETLIVLRRFFARLRKIPDSTFHYAASNLGNKCSQPEFHMYHMHLELRWLFVLIVHAKTINSQSLGLSFDDLDDILQLVFDDLVYVSMKMFERINITDLRLKNPYSCTCARELWLMMQIFIEEAAQHTKCKFQNFWEYVNSSLNKILNMIEEKQEQKIFWHCEENKELPRSKNPELFAAWLIYHLALLHGYDRYGHYIGTTSKRITPNYEQIDRILKGFVSRGGKDGDRDEMDEELRVMIPLVRVIVDEWWPTRVQIISFLWDCFHRRLEQPFLLQTAGPWSVSLEKKTPGDVLKQIRDRIDGNFDHGKESSYGMFLRFVGTFLKKIYDKNDTRHWNQVKGRIYSKFSKNKVQEFGEAGLYNFISLFLTLAVTADTTNVCSVMLDLLPPVQEANNENGRRYNLSWKGELAVLLLYNENSLNLESISSNFTKVINVISCRKDENARSMMASFVDTFGQIISSSDKLDNGEHFFVGGWIDRYLLECPKNRISVLIKILLEILAKCSRSENSRTDSGISKILDASRIRQLVFEPAITGDNSVDLAELEVVFSTSISKILDALWSFVASRIRQLVFEPAIIGDNYVDLAKLAVAFTTEALRNPAAAKRHKHSAPSLFQHFTSTVIVKDVRITKSYIVTILKDDKTKENLKSEVKNFDLIIIQAWIKCCFLGLESNQNDDTRFFKSRILIIPEIRRLFSSQAEVLDFEETEDSIFSFFTAIVKLRNSFPTEQAKNSLDARIRLYFVNIDKWALASISEESKETDLAFWIYRCIGTLILYCSTILYVKNQQNNALRTLVSKFVLPGEQSPQSYLKQLGKRIFSMILLGIETLSARSDLSLQVLIRDLFEAYLPLLVTENSGNFKIAESLLRCFADAKIDFCCLIFEKLAASFIIVSGDNATHKHCYLVILLLRNLLKSGRIYGNHVIEFIVAICVPNIVACYFKVHDLHPHKQQTFDFLSDVSANSYYREDSLLRDKFKNAVVTVVVKFLTFHSQCAFDFLRSIIRTNSEIVDKALPQIEKIIADLEKSKRPNAAALRYSLTQLQNFRKNT